MGRELELRDELLRVPPERVPPERDELELRDELLRDVLRAPLVFRAPLLRVVFRAPPLRELLEPLDFARVAAPLRAAVLRLAAVRLRVAAAFFPPAERPLDVDPPPRALLSIWSASPRSSSTVLRTSFDELSPASAIARAARLRKPLARSLLNRSLSSVALAMFSSCLATGRVVSSIGDAVPLRSGRDC